MTLQEQFKLNDRENQLLEAVLEALNMFDNKLELYTEFQGTYEVLQNASVSITGSQS